MLNERRLFVVVAVAATALRFAHIATSLGSTDAYLWSLWAGLLEHAGVLRSYQFDEFVNHPPLGLTIALACSRLARTLGLQFIDVFRGVQVLADLVTAVALVRLARGGDNGEWRVAPALFFLLSPGAIFISGFHCNSDPLMMMFVVLAATAAVSSRPITAGVLLACAIGIKIVPLLLGPLFLLVAFRDARSRLRFVASAAITGLVIFVPALLVSGPLFLQRVFGYSGMVRGWGLPVVSYLFEQASGWSGVTAITLRVLPFVELAAVCLLAVVAFRRRLTVLDLPSLLGTTLLAILVLAPGFGLQYLFWPLPFLWFVLPRPWPLAIHGAIGAYLFGVYTVWSGGWPWWYAERAPSVEMSRLLSTFAGLVWLLLVLVTILALRRVFAASPAQIAEEVP